MKILLVLSFGFNLINCAPILTLGAIQNQKYPNIDYGLYNVNNINPMNQKFFWSQIINQIDWLPIEVNVPDVINNIASGIQTGVGGFVQRIPIINGFIRPETPRPMSYVVLVPMQRTNNEKLWNEFEQNGMYP